MTASPSTGSYYRKLEHIIYIHSVSPEVFMAIIRSAELPSPDSLPV